MFLLKEIQFPTKRAIEYSYAAFRVKGGYKKDIGDDDDSNKGMILRSLCFDYSKEAGVPLEQILYVKSVETLVVTDEDRENAKLVDEKLKKYSFYMIGDRLTDFQKNIFKAASQEFCNVRSLNLIASMPQAFANEDAATTYRKRLKTEFANSQFVTTREFAGTVEVLKTIHVREHGYYVYICGADGNLFRFTNPRKHDQKFLKIKGLVKEQEKERELNLNMTRLNYVRIN